MSPIRRKVRERKGVGAYLVDDEVVDRDLSSSNVFSEICEVSVDLFDNDFRSFVTSE